MHGAWAFAVKHCECSGYQLWQIIGMQSQGRKGGNWRSDRALVLCFVQAAPTFAKAIAVVDAGNHQHRNRVSIGLADRRSSVGDARSADYKADSRLTGYTCVAVGHKASTLFMAG